MGDDLGGGGSHSAAQTEGVHSPGEVGVPALSLEGQALAECGLVDLDDAAATDLQGLDLLAECKGQLEGLDLAGDVGAWERPYNGGSKERQCSERTARDVLMDTAMSVQLGGCCTKDSWRETMSVAVYTRVRLCECVCPTARY